MKFFLMKLNSSSIVYANLHVGKLLKEGKAYDSKTLVSEKDLVTRCTQVIRIKYMSSIIHHSKITSKH
jgi:hypothetical protein